MLTCIKQSQLPHIYNLGDPQLDFGITISNMTFVEKIKLTPFTEVVTLGTSGTEIKLPSFVKHRDKTNLFSLKTESLEDVGKYSIGLKTGYRELKGDELICTETVEVVYSPTFVGEPLKN